MFDWDENIMHIKRHGVTVAEVEYVLTSPTLAYGYQDWHDEDRFVEVGQTAGGRILLVVTTERAHRLRVVTAYDADGEAKEEYLRSR